MNHQQHQVSGRRNFIRKIGAGTALSSLAPLSWESPFFRSSLARQEKLGIALVGLGYYSTQVLAPALQQTTDCYLAGIVTGTPAKEKQWQDKYGIKKENIYNYENFDQIADNDEIDIVYVVLPNSMHAEYTIRAARAGKHVICEKPMALNVAECEAMISACRDHDRMLSIGYRMQFEPHTHEVMRMGQEQVFGPLMMVSAAAGYRESRADHWKLRKEMGGGAMMDMGVYPLQAARYVSGEEPISVSAQSFTNRPELFSEVDDTTTFQLKFPSGAVASLITSFDMSVNYMSAVAQQGWFKLEPFSSYSGIKGRSSQGPISFPQINQQAAQMDEVSRCIQDGKPMRVPGEEGLRDIRVVEAIYRSIEEDGQTIMI